MKQTRHNGRKGKNGAYNPKHNDRNFDTENSRHIDPEKSKFNVYWDCYQGLHTDPDKEYTSFEDVERSFYSTFYSASVEEQNERNIAARHPERNRTIDDLYTNGKTCPEETIFQYGKDGESIPPELLIKICCRFITEIEERYGEYVHVLDWALHVDEGTAHIQERHVFDFPDSHGHLKPQQDKALIALGFELPDPTQKRSRYNNRKMSYDATCRELLFDIAAEFEVYPDREPTYGGRKYLEKTDYQIAESKKKLEAVSEDLADTNAALAQAEADLSEVNLRIQNVESLIDEVTDAAYEKACEVVTESAVRETANAALGIISSYQHSVEAPDSKVPKRDRPIMVKALTGIRTRISSMFSRILERVHSKLLNPQVAKENKIAIRETAKESVLAKMKRLQEEHSAEQHDGNTGKRKSEVRE